MKKYKYFTAFLIVLIVVTGMSSGLASPARAQSEDGWTEPVNLSNSGSSTNPSIVVDSQDTIHVFWLDEFDGYKYVNSTDGVTWSEPKKVQVPFYTDAQNPIRPVMLPGANEIIHIFWLDARGALLYRRSTSASLGNPSTWSGGTTLADSAVKFDAVIDPNGAVHVGYINSLDEENAPSGIYYRNLLGSGWSKAQLIYPSKYYRSLEAGDDANIQLAASTVQDAVNVYAAWDDRSQKRVFLAKSSDGGKAWDGAFEVRGPDDFSGLEMPFNIDLGAVDEDVLLSWQAGTPEGQCAQYSQWSTDGAKQFGQPVELLADFAQCPQTGQFLLSDKDYSVVLLNTFGELSLAAWDGSRWSKQISQSDIASFVNPVTLDNVIVGCQNVTSTSEKIYLAGCDTGQGGDIWFSSRPVGAIDDWFPPPSKWSQPEVMAETDQKISTLLSIADNNNNIHDIWIQDAPEDEQGALIQYARWNGEKWSNPSTVISGANLNPVQSTISLDSLGKLLLAWVDDATGDMYFTWANSDRASSASEWQPPIYIPSVSSANSSPDIVTDSSGKMLVAYAVPINEDRGIYIVGSDDSGASWSKPYRVFDASTANWHMVDRPQVALTGDGRLHILFERYTLLGDQRRSDGLYYIQSSDGGVTWSQPEQLSDQPILWSDLISYGESDIHRIWQEDRGSSKASLHQYSSDAGTTWENPNTLSNLADISVINHISKDLFGNLYFQQLTGPEDAGMLDQRWDSSGWKVQTPKALEIDTKTLVPAYIASSVSSDGHLVASVLGDSPDTSSKPQSQIVTLAQFIENSDPAPTPYPALIPAASLGAEMQTVGDGTETTTPESPLANIDYSRPFLSRNSNLVGLFLLGGVLVLLVLIIAATSRSKGKGKTKSS